MNIVHFLEEVPKKQPFVFAVGTFDGLHLGHVRVIQTARRLAEEKHAQLGIITFFPHPASVLFPNAVPALLQTEKEKTECLARLGAETAVILRPTREFLNERPDMFLDDLQNSCDLKGIAAGENFTFGIRAEGNMEFMRSWFAGTDVTVREVPLVTSPVLNGNPISSTDIRRFLREGNVAEAAALLGREYVLSGTVVRGFRRGSGELGFPTANITPEQERDLPADGVYATWTELDGHKYPSVTNVGTNPTFGNTKRMVETHILSYNDEIYGQYMKIRFAGRIRGEIRFPDAETLRKQIESDIRRAEKILNENKKMSSNR